MNAERAPYTEKTWPLTHRVAVGAYVYCGERMLLLKRANPPCVFAPPGGKLELNEEPYTGIKREVKEETGLDVDILGLANLWFGSVDGLQPLMLGIDFLARSKSHTVHLSDEHTDFVWASRSDIERGKVESLTALGYGYKTSDLLNAFAEFERHRALGMTP